MSEENYYRDYFNKTFFSLKGFPQNFLNEIVPGHPVSV